MGLLGVSEQLLSYKAQDVCANICTARTLDVYLSKAACVRCDKGVLCAWQSVHKNSSRCCEVLHMARLCVEAAVWTLHTWQGAHAPPLCRPGHRMYAIAVPCYRGAAAPKETKCVRVFDCHGQPLVILEMPASWTAVLPTCTAAARVWAWAS